MGAAESSPRVSCSGQRARRGRGEGLRWGEVGRRRGGGAGCAGYPGSGRGGGEEAEAAPRGTRGWGDWGVRPVRRPRSRRRRISPTASPPPTPPLASLSPQSIALEDVAEALPTLSPTLRALGREAVEGKGFQVIRGFPVDRWSQEDSSRAFWIVGLHWGKAVPTNAKGHLIGHVADVGADANLPTTRLYTTSAAQPFHNDAADLVALLCLRGAKSGGGSLWSSSQSVANAILSARPDLVETLREPLYWDRKGEVRGDEKPYFAVPAFNYLDGKLSVNWSSNYFFLAQRHPEVPRLSTKQLEAIELFDSLAGDARLALRFQLQPGDLQLLSDHTVLHAREAFEDWVEEERPKEAAEAGPKRHPGRHLLRLWLSPEDDRPLPDAYKAVFGGSVEVGNRGGILLAEGTELSVPLEP